jgi:hypothetical protein
MPGFAGFDISGYPGDAAMNWLKANTNLVWCGYYLAAPSHPHSTWLGKRAQLSAAGWGIAPVFVGQQVIPPGSQNPSAATGVADGNQAVTQMTNEGFAAGSCMYLDLENGPPLTNAQRDYVTNWCDTVQQGGFAPGIYCSHLLAAQVSSLRPDCRIWAFKLTNQPSPVPAPFPNPAPAGSGFAGAAIWQLAQNCSIRVQNSSLKVDLDSATVEDPGAPLAVPEDAAAAG